jgi:hypothetical protein
MKSYVHESCDTEKKYHSQYHIRYHNFVMTSLNIQVHPKLYDFVHSIIIDIIQYVAQHHTSISWMISYYGNNDIAWYWMCQRYYMWHLDVIFHIIGPPLSYPTPFHRDPAKFLLRLQAVFCISDMTPMQHIQTVIRASTDTLAHKQLKPAQHPPCPPPPPNPTLR